MKILLVHNYYKSNNIGGEDIVFDRELNYIRDNYKNLTVFSHTVCNDDLKLYKLPFQVVKNINQCKKIENLIKNEKIGVVHFHNFFPLLTASVFKTAKLAGAMTILTLHNFRRWCISGILYRSNKGICYDCIKKSRLEGVKYKCYRNSFMQSMLASFAFQMYEKLDYYRFIDKFITLTNFQKEEIIKLGVDEKKISVKPNFMDSAKNYEFNYKNRNGYLYIGRLEEAKGIKLLIETWNKLNNDYELNIIGTGPLSDYILQNIGDNIHYIGKMQHEKVLKHIRQSRFVVQPSLIYETFGLTILESFSYGVPVIGFNIGTRKDLIQNEYNGFLCNEDTLLDTIKRSADYKEYERLALNAIISSKKYSAKNVITQQMNLYRELQFS